MRLIKRPIKKKIMLGFGAVIALMIVSNAFVLFQLNSISGSAKTTLTNNVTGIDLVKHLQTILIDEERNAQKFVISRDQAYYNLFVEGSREFDVYMDSLLLAQPTAEETELFRAIRRTHASFVNNIAGEQSLSTETGSRNIFLSALSDSLSTVYSRFDLVIRSNQLSINNSIINVETTTRKSLAVAFILTIGTLLMAIILAVFIALTITQPIKSLISGTEKIAGGSFEPIHVSSNDEIALLSIAINEMSEKLKKISEYKAEMLHQISHEIRSPLQTLLWTHNYLMSKHPGSLNEKQLEMLDAMGVTIERLTKFSNQFLDLTKTEAGMMQYNLERTDVIALVVNIVKEMEFGALNKKITISLDIQSAPEVMIDAEKMSVVIGNLISNAIKYTKENGNIRVSAGASGRNIRISVTDSGIGIPEKELAYVFKKFYRASNAAASGGAGAGVGLALVKAFTEGHGGKISVTSTPGSGSTFTIKLPINSGNSKAVQPVLKEKQNL